MLTNLERGHLCTNGYIKANHITTLFHRSTGLIKARKARGCGTRKGIVHVIAGGMTDDPEHTEFEKEKVRFTFLLYVLRMSEHSVDLRHGPP